MNSTLLQSRLNAMRASAKSLGANESCAVIDSIRESIDYLPFYDIPESTIETIVFTQIANTFAVASELLQMSVADVLREFLDRAKKAKHE